MSDINLLKFKFGSALYGTADEQSDIDSKIVFLPDHGKVLLGHKIKNRVERDIRPNEKMSAGEEEIEYIPLQRLAYDFLNGQSYAYEIVFAFRDTDNFEWLFSDTELQSFVRTFFEQLGKTFLTSDISKMVGYAAHQAQVYGVKGERLNAVERLLEVLERVENPAETRLEAVKIPMTFLNNYVCYSMIRGSNEEYKNTMALQVNDRFYHLGEKVANVIDALKILVAKYGHRAKKAQEKEVDWKALSHAIRIAYQANLILTRHALQFPLPIHKLLRSVKRGHEEFDKSVKIFEKLNNNMEKLLPKTKLPPKSPELLEEFEEWLIQFLIFFYSRSNYLWR